MCADRVRLGADDAFAQLGRIVLGEQPLVSILEQVVHLAKQVLPAPVEASITFITGDDPVTVAFTGQTALELDERQYEAERGPCLDAAASGQLVSIPDMTTETRWPRFAQTAVEHGIRSSLSIPLPVQREVTGALNFYAGEPGAFSDESAEMAQTFA